MPQAGLDQVLIKVMASGICGSDKWLWRVDGPREYTGGHEASGQVVELGPDVKRLRVGDRVAINNVIGCGTCPACLRGDFVKCPRRPGYDVDNGFAEFLVAPERNCLLLDDRVSYEEGCLLFDNWGTPHSALKRAGVVASDTVIVFGCGPIGLAAISLARLMGARVFAVDPQAYRRDAAMSFGAERSFAPSDMLPYKATVVMECSGKAPAYSTGLAALEIGGKFVCVGEGARFELLPSDTLIRNHITMVGSWYSGMQEGRELQEMTLTGSINPSSLVTHRAHLTDFPKAFATACECEEGVLKSVIYGGDTGGVF